MSKPTRLAALYLAVVFLAGSVFGFVAHTLYGQRSTSASVGPRTGPGDYRARYTAKLARELALSPEQLAQVTTILDETGDRFRQLRNRMDPEFDAIRQNQRSRLAALLSAEQQVKYTKILEEHDRARKQHGPSR